MFHNSLFSPVTCAMMRSGLAQIESSELGS